MAWDAIKAVAAVAANITARVVLVESIATSGCDEFQTVAKLGERRVMGSRPRIGFEGFVGLRNVIRNSLDQSADRQGVVRRQVGSGVEDLQRRRTSAYGNAA
jgi:hypothetical protein